jgi:galactokinase
MISSRIFRAPGRVNLIGEHTDYNLGFVLPIALDLATYIESAPTDDGQLHVWSEERREERSWPVSSIASAQSAKHWSDYVAGVARELAGRGVEIQPLTLKIRSDVPVGAGLSSSAALEVATAFALLQGRDFDRLEIAKLCQRAETDFVGMPCGIMDQFVAVFGRENAAIRLDCRSLEYQTVELPRDIEIVAVNSLVKHELGASAYRTRVAECAIAVDAIRRRFPEVKSLRDATPDQLDKSPMPRTAMRRARHVIGENRRVELFVHAAERNDRGRMGELLVESHRSMRHDYEITCDEVDFLVDVAVGTPGCFGARMTGGGFGGCTVNLLEPGAFERFVSAIRSRYRERFGIDPSIFRCVPAAGAGEICEDEKAQKGPFLAG